jgi:ABC-type bacteriocin/lantibiotic exporter with double-glycine peptidase domain
MINFDMLSFLLVLSGAFILTMSAGWALLKLLDVTKRRSKIERPESQTPLQVVSPAAIQREIQGKQGMLRRVFGELRPYSLSIFVLLIISLSAIPITLITPLPIKLIVDNVLGSSTLPGYLAILVPGNLQASKDYFFGLLWVSSLGARSSHICRTC